MQERVIALELLDQGLLPCNRMGELVDRRRQGGVGWPQPIERIVEPVYFGDDRIIIAQQPGARSKDVPVQSRVGAGEAIEFGKDPVETLGIRIGRPHRDPADQQHEDEQSNDGLRCPHGRVATTGAPR